MNKLILTACIITVLSGSAIAGTLNRAEVSADAKWVAHIDMSKMRSTRLWELIKTAPKDAKTQAGLTAMKTFLGFDPLNELTDITLYGATHEKGQGVCIAKGTFPRTHLRNLVTANKTHKTANYAGNTVYNWTDEKSGQPKNACFVNDQTLVMAGSMSDLKKAIDVITSGNDSLASSDNIEITEPSSDAYIFFHTDKLVGQMAQNQHANVIKNAQNIIFAAAESDAQTHLELHINAGSEEKALQLQAIIGGIIAFTTLSQDQNPEAAALAREIAVDIDGATIKIGLCRPSEEVYEWIKKHHEAKKACRKQ